MYWEVGTILTLEEDLTRHGLTYVKDMFTYDHMYWVDPTIVEGWVV
jgi:hypothetical protein